MSEDNGLPINHVNKGKIDIRPYSQWHRPYNGWNNYATFRVHHDILNGYQWDEGEDIYVDLLKAIVENAVFENSGAVGLIVDYANLFLNNVDWEELAETYNHDRKAEQSS